LQVAANGVTTVSSGSVEVTAGTAYFGGGLTITSGGLAASGNSAQSGGSLSMFSATNVDALSVLTLDDAFAGNVIYVSQASSGGNLISLGPVGSSVFSVSRHTCFI
jgi:hypothetical protein